MDLATFEQKIGVQFADKNLLRTAFTHRSYLNEHRSAGAEHNERAWRERVDVPLVYLLRPWG